MVIRTWGKMTSAVIVVILFWANPDIGRAQWYVSAEAGVSQPIDQISKVGTVKTDAEYKVGPALAGAIGYQFTGWRLEGELAWRDNSVDSFSVNTVSKNISNNNTGAVTAIVNALYDFENDSPVTPFLGAGLGIAFARQNIGYDVNRLSGHSDSIAWQLIGGVETTVSARISGFVKARYVSAPSLHFSRTIAAGTQNLSSEFDGLVFMVGIRRHLGEPSRKQNVEKTPGPWYISGQLGLASIKDQVSEGGGQRLDTGFAPGAFAALALGRAFETGPGRVRLELDLSTRSNDTRTLAFNGNDLTDVAANGAYDFVVMGNAHFDLDGIAGIRPSLGGGAGLVHSSVYSRYSGIFINGSDETFGYQLFGGLSYALGTQLELFGEARYLHAQNPAFRRVTSFETVGLRSQYRGWNFGLGFRYFFAKR